MTNKTLDYYNKNSEAFIQGTISADLKDMQNKFLNELNGNKILDFGCGSGRDTKCFIAAGYDVDAIDGSIELCKSASTYTGIQVKHMLFQDEFMKINNILSGVRNKDICPEVNLYKTLYEC